MNKMDEWEEIINSGTWEEASSIECQVIASMPSEQAETPEEAALWERYNELLGRQNRLAKEENQW
jgi:hypothetical protein